MKVTIELTTEEEIKTFYTRMIAPDKPNITVYATPKSEDPAPPEGFMQAPENVPFTAALDSAESVPQPTMNAPEIKTPQASETVSFDAVTKAAIRLMDSGKQAELRALLQQHGAQALPDLKDKPDQLAAFFRDLEVI